MTEKTHLEREITYHRQLYYDGVPEISDEEFDALIVLLKQVYPESPVLLEVGSSKDAKYKHKLPMGSLDNVFTYEEFEAWYRHRSPESPTLIIEPKLDGFSLSAEYEQGRLVRVLTRGDGRKGEDITANARNFKGVPEQLTSPDNVILRGEGVITVRDFETYNEEHPDKPFANRRNGAAGLAKRKDPCPEQSLITVFWFDASWLERPGYSTEKEKIFHLKRLLPEGVETVDIMEGTLDNIKNIYDVFTENRKAYKADCDGLVVKLNDIKDINRLGYDGLNPRFQVAFKLPAESAVVTLKSLRPKVNPSGRITPLASTTEAILDGAILGGSFACHNWDWVRQKKLSVGARVRISRHGGVIPQIDDMVEPGDGKDHQPDKCPNCGAETTVKGSYLYCSATCLNYRSSLERTVNHFEWLGLGPRALDRLIQAGALTSASDFWSLQEEHFEESGIGLTNGRKILKEIKSKSKTTLPGLLSCLGIENISESRFQVLVESGYDSVAKLESLIRDDRAEEILSSLNGIGQVLAPFIVSGLSQRLDLLKRLINHVTLEERVVGDSLAGYAIQFTGKMSMNRKQFQELVQKNGGKTSWKKDLKNLLVANAKSSSAKYKQAEEKGYDIITEEEFLSLIKKSS